MNYETILDPMHQTTAVCEYVSSRLFTVIQDQSVLELGPLGGWWTQELLKYAKDVTVIEYDDKACDNLTAMFGSRITVINDDFHYRVLDSGTFDAVVVLGTLYHSPAPVKLLEDIVKFCDPQWMIVDKTRPVSPETRSIPWDVETINRPGARQDLRRSSGVVFQPDALIIDTTLENLGYALQNEIWVDQTDLIKMPGLNFKNGRAISVFENRA